MKTLNKTLSLVLVLVMVLGLVGVAGAAFTDTADVKYTEAVDVMTGIGAINGYTDGTIKPTATITREEAAKLVCFAILGKDVAEKLNVGATGFSDVDAGRWSAPYISYLVGESIINGMGDGTFAPTANVTGYQFMKMMLCAAGYGANAEFTGTGWELAVAVAAGKCKITKSATGVDYTKAATREEAMLYAFNGIFVNQVEYNKAFATYLGKGMALSAGPGPSIAAEVYGYNDTTPGAGTSLKKNSGTVDGVAGYVWNYKGKDISSFVSDATVLATVTDGTAFSKLVDNTDTKYVGYQADAGIKLYVNGVAVASSDTTPIDLSAVTSNMSTTYDLRGVVIKFIDTDDNGKYDIVTVTNDTVYTLDADPIITTSGAVTKVAIGILGIDVDVTNVTGYEGLQKGDVILYHTYGTKHFITKCNAFTGTLNASSAVSVTVDGKTHKVSQLTNAQSSQTMYDAAAGKEATFYTDAGGFVVKAVPSTDTVTLTNTLFVFGARNADPFGGFTMQAKVAFGDGSSSTITVAKVGGVKPTATTDVTAANFYTYVKNTDGTYNLTRVAKQAITTAPVVKGAANLAGTGKLATTSTILMQVNTTTERSTTYVGVNNLPGIASPTSVSVIYDSNNYAVLAVVLNGTVDTSTSAKDYVFLTSLKQYTYDSTDPYYTYAAVVNGEITTIKAVLSSTLTNTLYSVSQYSDGKLYTAGVATTGDTRMDDIYNHGSIRAFSVNGTTVSTYTDTTRATLDTAFTVTGDCKVFVYDSANMEVKTSTVAALAALSTAKTYTIYGVEKSTTDSTICQLFVVY